MIHGLYLDHRVWDIDISPSTFWNPKQYGVSIDLPALKQTRIGKQKTHIDAKYKFAITTSVWEKPIRLTLQYLRKRGLKIFLLPREPFKFGAHKTAMFSHPEYLIGGEYFFNPDAVFSPGQDYANFWKDKTSVHVTGYPRFELYLGEKSDKEEVAALYGLDAGRKWIFFPDYPPVFPQDVGGRIDMVDLEAARDESVRALEEFARNTGEHQVVIKLHPHTWKSYTKYSIYLSDFLKEAIDNPRDSVRVVKDSWYSSTQVAKQLLEHSDVVVGHASTMMLEGAVLNKPLIYIVFGNTAQLTGVPEYDKYIPTVYNKDELFAELSSYTNKGNAAGLVKHYLHTVDGKACERICHAISEEMSDDK